ncbi:leucine-rich repeat-containing protein 72-like [Anneissia japonica]|uniref:leucine-rich repeat-containing protein 72-like n=1 Tax=Anneissia japonica TaxID=1529436 RepID=UPI0014256AAC|nr:leucine-rich repeat-containing protein 72-like [Anneissia japonica]
MVEVEQIVAEQMRSQGILKDQDVTQLYMANRKLTKDRDLQLSRFKNLKYLWLNGNRLRHIGCITRNFHMTELYLQDNELVDICGAVAHLTCLHTIMLQNNQLTKLEQTVKEFKAMQNLRVLNLSGNPIAQEPEYRFFVVYYVPSLQLLDRSEVLKQESDTAARYYNQDRQALLDTISFGRRWPPGPPRQQGSAAVPPYHQVNNQRYSAKPVPALTDSALSTEGGVSETSEDDRVMRHSVMQFSTVDWSKVPKSQERRIGDSNTKDSKGQIITVQFR